MNRTIVQCAALAGVIALGAACSDNPRHSTPEGRVAGEVLHGLEQRPMADVSVTLWTGDEVFETTTDEAGRFVMNGVPSGSTLWLDVVTEGFALQRYAVTVDDSAGEEAQSNSITLVDVRLFPADNNLSVKVLNSEGVPAQGVEVFATGRGDGFLLPERLSAVTGPDGVALLTGIAATQTYDINVYHRTAAGTVITAQQSFTHDWAETELDMVVVTRPIEE